MAAVQGDADKMRRLLQGALDDGKGVDIRTFRTSYADVDFIWESRRARINPNYTLIEIAVERDHFEVVSALTDHYEATVGAPGSSSSPKSKPPMVTRSVSTFIPASNGDQLRDLQASLLEVCPTSHALAGLVMLKLPAETRSTFLIPMEVMGLPLAERRIALSLMLEDVNTQELVEDAVSYWTKAVAVGLQLSEDDPELSMATFGLHALYTSGDGNCLLHAASLATYGIRDTREAADGEPGAMTGEELLAGLSVRRTLRGALHHSLLHCKPLRALLATHGCVLEGGVDGTEDTPLNADTMESRSRLHGNSCDPGHVLVLAHIFRRPIVCLAAASVGEVRDADGKSFSSYAAKGERMSGVYLPCLLDPSECSRDPITIIYTSGHFSALVASEMASSVEVWGALGLPPPKLEGGTGNAVPIPLVDETLNPLPLLFATPPPPPAPDATAASVAEHEAALLRKYVDVYEGEMLEAKAVPVTRQRVPVRQRSPGGGGGGGGAGGRGSAGSSDAFFELVWKKRVEEAQAPPPPPPPPDHPPPPAPLASMDSEKLLQIALQASLLDQGGEKSPVRESMDVDVDHEQGAPVVEGGGKV